MEFEVIQTRGAIVGSAHIQTSEALKVIRYSPCLL